MPGHDSGEMLHATEDIRGRRYRTLAE